MFNPGYEIPNLAAFIYVEEVHIRDTVTGVTGGHAVDVDVWESPSAYGDTCGIQPEEVTHTYSMI